MFWVALLLVSDAQCLRFSHLSFIFSAAIFAFEVAERGLTFRRRTKGSGSLGQTQGDVDN